MRFLHSSIKLANESAPIKQLFIYSIVAYCFGLGLRLILLYQIGTIEGFWDSGLPVSIFTPDAGRYGFYAKMILSGTHYPLSSDYIVGYFIAGISSLLHVSIDWVMLLLPAFTAPLIAVPLVIIGDSIKQPTMGFLAALLAVSGTFFYMRSHIGYMDTDSINLVLILVAISFIIKSFQSHRLLYSTLGAFSILLFAEWYHSASIIILLIFAVTLASIALFYRKDRDSLQLVFLLAVPLLPVGFTVKIVLIISLAILFFALNKTVKLNYRFYLTVLISGFLLSLFLLNPDHYLHRAMTYFAKNSDKTFDAGGVTYHYLDALKSVSEVQSIDLWKAHAPLLISVVYVVGASIGYALMLVAYPILIPTLPLIILGYMSGFVGMRFTMFATPVLALGAAYILYLLKAILIRKFGDNRYAIRLPYYGTIFITLLMIYNIFNINTGAMRSLYFYSTEKRALVSFSEQTTDSDSIISWWDYGWPLWYYTGQDNTLTDNGRHGGPDLHLVAKLILSDNPQFTANMANLLNDYRLPPNEHGARVVLPRVASESNLTELISSLHNEKYQAKKQESNAYILLHRRMLYSIGHFETYAKKDLLKSESNSLGRTRYSITSLVKPFSHNYSLVKGYSYIFDSSDGKVLDAKGVKTEVNRIMITGDNKRKQMYRFHNSSNEHLIVDRNKLIWLDKSLYNSFLIQAMLFDVYDKNLFEKVAETGRIKIFRVKKPAKGPQSLGF